MSLPLEKKGEGEDRRRRNDEILRRLPENFILSDKSVETRIPDLPLFFHFSRLVGRQEFAVRESERKKNRKIFLFLLARVRKISRWSYLIADRKEGGGSTFDVSARNASISLRINGRSPKGIALFTFSLINESKFRVFN